MPLHPYHVVTPCACARLDELLALGADLVGRLVLPASLTQMSILVMHMMQMQMRIRSLVLVRRFADVFWLVLRPPQAAINAYMMISLSLLVEMSILTVPRPCSPVFVSLIMLRLPRKKEPRIELMSVVMRTPG